VPEAQVASQPLTHHQLLQDYTQPLGNGNNMFISVSAPGDTESAPPGCRAVMISTHCDLEDWDGLSVEVYDAKKQAIGERLVQFARRVYPRLGETALVYETATPRTYETFTGRRAVGGVRLTLSNANQNALAHDTCIPGFWLVGDTTWPGLGTVACVMGSRIVAEGILRKHKPQPTQGAVHHMSIPLR
jgi:phytoene dehydrogenase-like protein